jgi:hypothetical protein
MGSGRRSRNEGRKAATLSMEEAVRILEHPVPTSVRRHEQPQTEVTEMS